MELMRIKDVMDLCRVGKATATRMAHSSGAIIPGRTKGQLILINKKKFERWLEAGR